MALTQTQLTAAVADRAEISRAEAKRVLAALDEIILEELGNAQKVRIGGLVQLTVRVKPAQKKRPGRNPGYQIRDIKNGWLEDRSAAGLEVFAARSGRNHQTERRCVAAFNLARQAGPGPRI